MLPSSRLRLIALSLFGSLAVMCTSSVAFAAGSTHEGISITLLPSAYEAIPGRQIVYTVTITNKTPFALSGLELINYSHSNEINFFLTSDGGEIHPRRITWSGLSLGANETKVIKMRSQILSFSEYPHIKTAVSLEGALLDTPIYAISDVRLLGTLPTTGVELGGR
jgi:hypothetical protein